MPLVDCEPKNQFPRHHFRTTYGEPFHAGEALTTAQTFARRTHNSTLHGIDCAHAFFTVWGYLPAPDIMFGAIGIVCDAGNRCLFPRPPEQEMDVGQPTVDYRQLDDADADDFDSDDGLNQGGGTNDEQPPGLCDIDMTLKAAINGRDKGWMISCGLCCTVYGAGNATYKAARDVYRAHAGDDAELAAQRGRRAAAGQMR